MVSSWDSSQAVTPQASRPPRPVRRVVAAVERVLVSRLVVLVVEGVVRLELVVAHTGHSATRADRVAGRRVAWSLLDWNESGLSGGFSRNGGSFPSSCPRRRGTGQTPTASFSAAASATQVPTPAIAVSTCVQRRERRRQPDVAVARVLAVGEGRPGRGERDAGLLGQLDHPRGGAVEHVEVDEVARRSGRVHSATPRPSSAEVRAASTAANLGAMISRCRRMWSRTPSAEPKNSTCRSWLTLSGPIDAHGEVPEVPRHCSPRTPRGTRRRRPHR